LKHKIPKLFGAALKVDWCV